MDGDNQTLPIHVEQQFFGSPDFSKKRKKRKTIVGRKTQENKKLSLIHSFNIKNCFNTIEFKNISICLVYIFNSVRTELPILRGELESFASLS